MKLIFIDYGWEARVSGCCGNHSTTRAPFVLDLSPEAIYPLSVLALSLGVMIRSSPKVSALLVPDRADLYPAFFDLAEGIETEFGNSYSRAGGERGRFLNIVGASQKLQWDLKLLGNRFESVAGLGGVLLLCSHSREVAAVFDVAFLTAAFFLDAADFLVAIGPPWLEFSGIM